MRVLLLEERAHLEVGHYPHWVAQTARELSADGHEVHVLTRHGWLNGRHVDHAVATYRMTRRHRIAGRMAAEVRRQSSIHLGDDRGRALVCLGDSVRHAMLVAAIRHCVHRLGDDERMPVIILSRASPVEAAICAPRDARWVVYAHDPPSRVGGALHSGCAVALAAGRERRRRRHGGFVRLVVNNAVNGKAWREHVPWLEYEVIRAAGRSLEQPAPRGEARRALELPEDGRIALFFGTAHGGKDVDTLLRAFAGDDAPARLVVAGEGAGDAFAAAAAAHPELGFPAVTVIDGYVSEEQVHLLHSAADYAVLSFLPSWPNDSATMGDAVGHGIPVCCSETADHGRVVRRYRLGELFEPGNPDSLRAAARRMAAATLDAADQAAYLSEFSPQALTRRLLAAATGQPADLVASL